MNAFSEMYDEGTELDARLEQASYLLKEAADEAGVDLNQFNEEDLSGMIADIANSDGPGEAEGEESDEGAEYEDDGEDEEGGKTASDVTLADVTLELSKRAAAEGIDLAQLDRATHEHLLNQVAAEMTDPAFAYEQAKVAAAYEQMDEYGRVAARGFVDELNKLAADEEKKDEDDDEDDVEVKVKKAALLLKLAAGDPGKLRKAWDAAKGHGGKAWGAAKGKARAAGNWAGRKERGISERVGRASSRRPLQYNQAIDRGRKVLGGVAAGGAVGAGGTALAMRGRDKGRKKKASLEELAYAVDILREHGIAV